LDRLKNQHIGAETTTKKLLYCATKKLLIDYKKTAFNFSH